MSSYNTHHYLNKINSNKWKFLFCLSQAKPSKTKSQELFLDVKYSENIHCEFSVTDTVQASSTNFGNSDGS